MDAFNGPKKWVIEEQILDDPASGLKFQFEVLPNGYCALRVFGDLPYGNREIMFDDKGQEAGAGTVLQGPHVPTWHLNLDD